MKVEVAHTVVIHALTVGDITMARNAADVAILAAPDDETARQDLVDVLHAEDHAPLKPRRVQGWREPAAELRACRRGVRQEDMHRRSHRRGFAGSSDLSVVEVDGGGGVVIGG